jgi:uncharacterized protein YjiS (DUF1127 family)
MNEGLIHGATAGDAGGFATGFASPVAPRWHVARDDHGAIRAALRILGRLLRRLQARRRAQRQARYIAHALGDLDDRALRDLGIDRGEISSLAAEATGQAPLTRIRAGAQYYGLPT